LREPVAAYAVAQEPESLQEDVLEPPAEMYWIETEVQEFPQGYIEIRSIGEGEVVTVIEVISPSNKTPGHGRDSYLQKQDEVLATSVNLVEFDLLRGGLHTLAAPAELLRPAHYRVCIRPGDQRRRFCISDFSVRDPLVPVSIPLHPGKEPVVLDLPGVLARCYEVGSYAAQIDYTQPPDPPLEPEDEAWADAFLREKGLRQEGKPL
jgi:hypothetical protein